MALHQSSSLSEARLEGLEASKKVEARPVGGERGARDGNIFEVEQAQELPIDLGEGGSSPNADLIQMASFGPHHLQIQESNKLQGKPRVPSCVSGKILNVLCPQKLPHMNVLYKSVSLSQQKIRAFERIQRML